MRRDPYYLDGASGIDDFVELFDALVHQPTFLSAVREDGIDQTLVVHKNDDVFAVVLLKRLGHRFKPKTFRIVDRPVGANVDGL